MGRQRGRLPGGDLQPELARLAPADGHELRGELEHPAVQRVERAEDGAPDALVLPGHLRAGALQVGEPPAGARGAGRRGGDQRDPAHQLLRGNAVGVARAINRLPAISYG
jgi:hypothetical protein